MPAGVEASTRRSSALDRVGRALAGVCARPAVVGAKYAATAGASASAEPHAAEAIPPRDGVETGRKRRAHRLEPVDDF